MKRGLNVIGLLNIYMPEVYEFSEEEINFVTIAASQASSVVQNARMCRRLKDNIDEINEYKEQLEDNIRQQITDYSNLRQNTATCSKMLLTRCTQST